MMWVELKSKDGRIAVSADGGAVLQQTCDRACSLCTGGRDRWIDEPFDVALAKLNGQQQQQQQPTSMSSHEVFPLDAWEDDAD